MGLLVVRVGSEIDPEACAVEVGAKDVDLGIDLIKPVELVQYVLL